MKRRDFLRNSTLASTAMFTPNFLRSSAMANASRLASRSGKILIVLQLSGGNDGLNTVIPFGDDLYYQNRPVLGIPRKEVLGLNDHQGLHPALLPLRKLYDRGEMTIINSVGYPNPDRSHFRSMDIWQTGSPATESWSTGWIGRHLDTAAAGKPAYHALEVDDGLSLAMKGATRTGFAMSRPDRLRQAVRNQRLHGLTADHTAGNPSLGYLYKTLTETTEAAGYLFEQSKVKKATADYPKGAFGRDLKQIAELITADTATNIYYASLGGFDTHVQQQNRQQRLLAQYAQSVAALVEDLKANNLFNDVLIMTFSEFGRRLKQNASGGTDHGTANNVFLMGGKLKTAGIFNNAPNLSTLDRGDIIHEIDFRRCYATLIDDWLEGDSMAVLGQKFASLGVV
ncbi:DUF1501 domain-containing protein [Neolewinella agarilytica]|uniref:Uncharacterized conserved protein, DUF1501 family n=1 Tax=Neolewinella agarilytica TaxID=478744 RepID=A0A1H9HQU2_9BACT|nr:DUF1501 domain-containing protein [Neolewinella agarilytica]SEQ64646.1 Uncharacterized conserved protein, DUF1501 family [Neolewinella agarilytica]